ncbi:NAD(P)/FAD-dependent oxidoreductase [Streptomyces phaeochromogenes]|uniref:NAD(P)/FAD-dependent oxidoreductase n=1 Tax=Streptomyces phaeochromogenes TaxID=1923 RepID=UPI0036981351
MTGSTHAVVLGGSIAGTLAAVALSRHVQSVTIVDRDVFPTEPDFRRGLPQARHAHLLLSGGARIIETLMPGATSELIASGAHHREVPTECLWLTAYGWQHRFPATEFIITCSRTLLDWTLRDHALRTGRITVMDGTEVLELCGDAHRVTGVRVRGRGADEPVELTAGLVVDATGRGSPLKQWLAALKVEPVQEDLVDTGIAYATRVFRAPFEENTFPLVNVLADHRARRPGQNATLVPIEGDRLILTLSGTRGGEPPSEESQFLPFARRLRSPLIADLLEHAEPLTGVYGSRSTANRRRHYERIAAWPEGLVAIGDSVAAFNPIYAHGLSAAAHCADALARGLDRTGLAPGLAASVQRSVGVAVDDPWMLAASQDLSYPDCRTDMKDPRLVGGAHAQSRTFADMVGDASLRDPDVHRAAVKVTTLSAPVNSLEAPEVIAALRRGAAHPPLTRPPLTARETAMLNTTRGGVSAPEPA